MLANYILLWCMARDAKKSLRRSATVCEQGHAERVGGSAYLVSDIEWMRYQ